MTEIVASRYKTEHMLGEGAAGRVYLARDLQRDSEPVALKILEAPGSRHLELLRHEFSMLRNLSHPNIAQVFDFGLDEKSGHWFYTTEYIDGNNILEACSRLDFADQVRLFAQILRALQHIHSKGVIHYDVKPSNIVINNEGAAKLIDFGLATTETPISGAMRGTIGYAAPEVVRGELGDPRSDLYSLGVIFYEAITGRRPFVADSALEILKMQATEEPKAPRKFNDRVPSDLERVIQILLERDPASRYYAANEVNQALSLAVGIPIEEETTETVMAYPSAGALIGRDAERSQLVGAVEKLPADESVFPLYMVTGEVGIGKTRLLREVCYKSQLAGLPVYWCRCTAVPRGPFGHFSEAVQEATLKLPRKKLQTYHEAISALEGDKQDKQEDEHVFNQAAQIILESCVNRSAILAIDDLDSCDPQELRFLSYLIRSRWLRQQEDGKTGLLIFCTCNRDRAGEEPLSSVIEWLESENLAKIFDLQPFSEGETRQILKAMFGRSPIPEEVVDSIATAASGSPLIVEQSVQELLRSGTLFYEAGRWHATAEISKLQLPTAAEDVLRHRIASLECNELSIVEALACIACPAGFEMLCEISDLESSEFMSALRELISCRVLVLDDNGDYAFLSGQMQKVVPDTISRKRWRKIHRRIYDHLGKSKADLTERALHAARAGLDKRTLLPILKKAAKDARNTASITQRLELYQAIKSHSAAKSEGWFSALNELAALYRRNNDIDKALECFRELESDKLWQYPDIAVSAVSGFVNLCVSMNRIEDAERFVKAAENKLWKLKAKRYQARILSEQAYIRQAKGDMDAALELFTGARDLALKNRDYELINAVEYKLAVLDFRMERFEESAGKAKKILRRKSAAPHYEAVHNLLGAIYTRGSKFDKALEHFSYASKEARKTGDLIAQSILAANIGNVYLNLGEYDKALRAEIRAKRIISVLGEKADYIRTLINIAGIYLLQGNIKQALAICSDCIEAVKEMDNPAIVIPIKRTRAFALAHAGQTEAALNEVGAAEETADEMIAKGADAHGLILKAYILANLCGETEKAESTVSEAIQLASPADMLAVSGGLLTLTVLKIFKREYKAAREFLRRMDGMQLRGSRLVDYHIVRAELMLAENNWAKAAEILSDLEDIPLDFEQRAYMNLIRSRLALANGNIELAVSVAVETLRIAERGGWPLLIVRSATAAAKATLAEESKDIALEHLEKAEQAFEKIASALPPGYNRRKLRAFPLYARIDTIREQIKSRELKLPEASHAADRYTSEAEGAFEQVASAMPEGYERDALRAMPFYATLEKLKSGSVEAHAKMQGERDRRVSGGVGLLARLLEVNKRINSQLELPKLLNEIIDAAIEVTGAQRGFLIIREAGKENIEVSRNLDKDDLETPESQLSRTVAERVLQSGEALLSTNAMEDKRFADARSISELQLRAVLCVPIKAKGSIIGCIYLDNPIKEGAFGEGELELAAHVSEQAAIAIDNSRLYRQAVVDSLTEMYTHQYFDLRLKEELTRAERYGRHLSLLLVDIDRFKMVNDLHGHQVGSELLKRMSTLIQDNTRQMVDSLQRLPEDAAATLGRYGGDEFEVLLPETGREGACTVALRLLRKVQEEVFSIRGAKIQVTLSIGVATYPEDAKDGDSLFHKADEALYGAKRAGRNRVHTSSEGELVADDLTLKRETLEAAGIDPRLLTRDGLALLGMITRLSAVQLNVQELLSLCLSMALDITRAERGFIILVDEDGNLKYIAARDIADEEITTPEYQTSHTMVRQVIKTGKPYLVTDTMLDQLLSRSKSVVDLGLRSVLCVPILSGDAVAGVVYLDTTSLAETFSEADLILMEEFTCRIAPIIERAIEQHRLQSTLRSLQEEVQSRYAYTSIIGTSKPMRELFRVLDSVTDTDLTVNIYGETGTGKELVAKALHYNGPRKEAPFISVDCAALPESLLESELFGHVKGAFTGASADRPGLIEAADTGTLFLDEIGSMPLGMQAKLLRVIEEREVRRVGATASVSVDIRIVCATNTPLESLVEQGIFREDFFYRINVVRVEVPPLRDRREDIPPLVQHFISETAKEMGASEKEIDPEALAKLYAYSFPGNVRQLRNIIQQAFVASGDRITAREISEALGRQEQLPEPGTALVRELSVEEYMKEFILTHQHQYSETELAKKLGIGRNSLWRKRKEWNLPKPE